MTHAEEHNLLKFKILRPNSADKNSETPNSAFKTTHIPHGEFENGQMPQAATLKPPTICYLMPLQCRIFCVKPDKISYISIVYQATRFSISAWSC